MLIPLLAIQFSRNRSRFIRTSQPDSSLIPFGKLSAMQPKPPENPNTGPIPTDQNRQIKARLSKDHAELDLWDFDGDGTPPGGPSKDSSARGGAIPAPPPAPDPSKRNVTRPKEGFPDRSDKLQHLPIPPRKKSQSPASAN